MQLRTASDNDLPGIVAIYNQAIAEQFCTGHTEPLTVAARRAWFAEHSTHAYPITVAEQDGRLLGWCSLSPYRAGRAALRRTAEISYYIDATARRQGIGSLLLQHALQQAPALGLTHLLAILMDVNVASQRLLERFDFQQWGHLPGIARFGDTVCGQYIYGRKL